MKICKVKDCTNIHVGLGYCHKHRLQYKRYGKILKRTKYDKNVYIDKGEYYEICLYSKAKAGEEPKEKARTKIDKKDYKMVKEFKWALAGGNYVRNLSNNIGLSQLILGKKEGYEIDHINRNKLDNRRKNLRHATRTQNCQNRKTKGYHWKKANNKWRVVIKKDKKVIFSKYFDDENNAKKAVERVRNEHFGEFSPKFNNPVEN